MARDGFGIGVNVRGLYQFNGAATGNAFADFLLGNVSNRARDHYTARGPLDGHSDDFALFVQDDWRVSKNLTVFLGLRYELVGMWHEKSDMLANFPSPTAATTSSRTPRWRAKLPPGLQDLGRTLTRRPGRATRARSSTRTRTTSARGWASPGGRAATTGPCVRGGFGLFHPTVAVQGVRDLLATNEFRYYQDYRGGPLQNAFSAGTPYVDPDRLRQPGHRPEPPEPRHLPVQPDPRARARRRHGRAGELHRLDDAEAAHRHRLQHRWRPTPSSSTRTTREPTSGCPYYPYGTYMDIVENKGEGQLHALQVGLTRRWRNGLAFDVAYTYAHSDTTVPDSGNSTIGVVLYNPWDPRSDRGPDPNVVKHRVVANATWDIPVGKGRKYGSNMPGWADALFGGWTVSTIFQARSGLNLTPFFYGFYSTSPWNTAKPLDGLGNCFCGAGART